MGRSDTNRKNILVVEDDAPIADMLIMLLELEGYRVCWARNAEEARRQLTHGTVQERHGGRLPDLVLLDLQLPDMDGAAMIQMIQAANEHVPPIIVLSAGRDHAVEHAAHVIHAADVLVKPFDVQNLLDRVTHVMGCSA